MAKCPQCNRRKGKRLCPALNAEICETCCGTRRIKEIPCPLDCPIFQRTELERKRRLFEKDVGTRRWVPDAATSEERITALQLNLERVIAARDRSFHDVTDHEILAELQAALKAADGEAESEADESQPHSIRAAAFRMLKGEDVWGADIEASERRAAVTRVAEAVEHYAAEGGGSRHYVEFLHRAMDGVIAPIVCNDEVGEALRLLDQRRVSAAIEILEQQAGLHPDDAVIHDLLSQAYREIGRAADAFEEATKAVEINPTDVVFLEHLAVAAALSGRICAAWNVAEKALNIATHPHSRASLRAIRDRLSAEINAMLKQFPHLDAQRLFQFERAMFAVGEALDRGETERGEALLREALQINPQAAEAHALLGLICAQTEREDEAKQELMAALRIDPQHQLANQLMAMLQGSSARAPQPPSSGRIILP